MTTDLGVLIVIEDADDSELILERIERFGRFTWIARTADYHADDFALCLLATDASGFDAAGIVQRQRRVSTGRLRLVVSDLVSFTPLPFDALGVAAGLSTGRWGSGGARSVRSENWTALWEAVKALRPDDAEALQDLERELAARIATNDVDDPLAIFAQKRDSLALALRLFGLTAADQAAVIRTVPPPTTLGRTSFLLGVGQPNFSEDIMISHDADAAPGWVRGLGPFVGAVTFERATERLTVIEVNRQDVEHTLGVDLLYLHHKYDSFVFVQYKKMSRELGGPIFRPTGSSYSKELARMQHHDASLVHPPPGDEASYRLWPGAFFFKVCPKLDSQQSVQELVKGMYFPLDHWPLVVDASAIKGARGGIGLTYGNVGRYIDNSLFIALVGNGWVGSSGSDSVHLARIVNEALGLQHAVVIAASSSS